MRGSAVTFASWSAVCFVFASNAFASDGISPEAGQIEKSYRKGAWFVVETADFQVFGRESYQETKKTAANCMNTRDRLREYWLGEGSREKWAPKCQIVIHANLAGYRQAAGRGSDSTVGVSKIERRGEKVLRRIDLRGDHPDYLAAALPHEMTHVVLADRFAGNQIPRWTDEGMAVLADPRSKQVLHARDLRDGFARRTTFGVHELATLSTYPAADRWGVFYGQSVSVVAFLVERGGSQRFVDFVESAIANGYDKALRTTYGIPNLRELDRVWRVSVTRPRTLVTAVKDAKPTLSSTSKMPVLSRP